MPRSPRPGHRPQAVVPASCEGYSPQGDSQSGGTTSPSPQGWSIRSCGGILPYEGGIYPNWELPLDFGRRPVDLWSDELSYRTRRQTPPAPTNQPLWAPEPHIGLAKDQ